MMTRATPQKWATERPVLTLPAGVLSCFPVTSLRPPQPTWFPASALSWSPGFRLRTSVCHPSSSPHPQLVTPPAAPGKQALEGGTTPVTPATPYTGRPPSPPPPLSGPSSANFSGPFSRFILSLALSVDSSHQHLTYSFSLVLRNKIKTLLSPTPAGLRPAPHRLSPEPLPADELGAGRGRSLWFVTS